MTVKATTAVRAGATTVVFAGRETGEYVAEQDAIPLQIRTSRFFAYVEGHGWRQLHHHGSIDDTELLARYRTAVSGWGSAA